MAETVPPLSVEELEQDLINTEFAAYLYIGGEDDPGWKYARTAFSLIPRLRIYLITDASLIRKWTGNKKPAGVVFGWDDKVFKFLSKDEAEDLQLVLDTIQKAMES